MENTVFFRAKKLMETWYLLITKKFLFWTFQRWEILSFLSQKVDGKMIFTNSWKVLLLNFSVMGNMVFLYPESWWKDDIYLVLLSFPWYSRTWEIWFLVQCVFESTTKNFTKFLERTLNKQPWHCLKLHYERSYQVQLENKDVLWKCLENTFRTLPNI